MNSDIEITKNRTLWAGVGILSLFALVFMLLFSNIFDQPKHIMFLSSLILLVPLIFICFSMVGPDLIIGVSKYGFTYYSKSKEKISIDWEFVEDVTYTNLSEQEFLEFLLTKDVEEPIYGIFFNKYKPTLRIYSSGINSFKKNLDSINLLFSEAKAKA